MGRFEDTRNLFGYDSGSATSGTVTCGICGTTYNKGADDNEEYDDENEIYETTFAGLTVCECCYERIENAVLGRMDDILPWYERILKAQRKKLDEVEASLQAAKEAAESIT